MEIEGRPRASSPFRGAVFELGTGRGFSTLFHTTLVFLAPKACHTRFRSRGSRRYPEGRNETMARRGVRRIAAINLLLAVISLGAGSAQAQAPQTPQQLIHDVVFNELADHRHHGYFEYLDSKRDGRQTILKAEIETSAGRINRLLAQDGKPLGPEQQEQETRRLEALLRDSGERQKLMRDYQGDEDRIARIVGLLPEGFVYQYDGVEGAGGDEEIRLKYQPNPDFKPPTYEARVFHGMAGTVWINAREKRLSRLQGQLVANVDFGYGLLGRLDKGGTFNMERVEVSPGNWKTRALDVHITGYVVLLKSIGKDQTERRSNFRPVPANLTLQQAKAMLDRPLAANEIRSADLDWRKSALATDQAARPPSVMALK